MQISTQWAHSYDCDVFGIESKQKPTKSKLSFISPRMAVLSSQEIQYVKVYRRVGVQQIRESRDRDDEAAAKESKGVKIEM